MYKKKQNNVKIPFLIQYRRGTGTVPSFRKMCLIILYRANTVPKHRRYRYGIVNCKLTATVKAQTSVVNPEWFIPDHHNTTQCWSKFARAGQQTTIRRQRDLVFRPQNCWLQHYTRYRYLATYIRCGLVATSFRHRGRNIFGIFSCPWSSIPLSRCSCRTAKISVACSALIFSKYGLEFTEVFACAENSAVSLRVTWRKTRRTKHDVCPAL